MKDSASHFLSQVSGVTALQGAKARERSPSSFRNTTPEGSIFFPPESLCDSPEPQNSQYLVWLSMCEYLHAGAETNWYALVCRNIWHHKCIPAVLGGGGKFRYSASMMLTLEYGCLHLGNYRQR